MTNYSKIICLSITWLWLIQAGPLWAHGGDHFLPAASFGSLVHNFSRMDYWLLMAAAVCICASKKPV